MRPAFNRRHALDIIVPPTGSSTERSPFDEQGGSFTVVAMGPSGRRLAASWAQAWGLPGPAGAAMRATVEAEAAEAAAHAVDLAREALTAADNGRLGDALELIADAAAEAREATVAGWAWLDRQGQ